MKRIELNGSWQACGADENGKPLTFTGTVPGCVHTDLIRAGIIDYDIFYQDNDARCRWIEDRDFTYRRSFTLEQVEPDSVLVFEGLDTYCDIYLNDQLVGSADDMFIDHRFCVDGFLRKGENVLRADFRSPMFTQALPSRPAASTWERLYTRRIQCTYGWDWVPRFVTMGIFRDVYLTVGKELAVEHAYVYTRYADARSAQVVAELTMTGYEAGAAVQLSLISPQGKTVYRNTRYCQEAFIQEYMDVMEPSLWYPNGYGSQGLYTLRAEADGRVLLEQKLGIVTSRILRAPDEPGSPYYEKCLALKQTVGAEEYDHNEDFSGFQLLVNGTAVMCKGANWVPCEPFPSEETPEKIRRILEMAKDAGMTMIRVWGGGIFEQDCFYDECDRLGLMVTQDFLMACGSYPEEDEGFLNALRREAKHAALRLRNHPCLMWWTGDNENAVRGSDAAAEFPGRTAALQAILPVLREYDPQRRFLASSPWGGDFYASKTAGTTHNTQYLCNFIPELGTLTDYKEYFKNFTARFITEEPAMGAPERSTLRSFMTDGQILAGEQMWRAHSKNLSMDLFDACKNFCKDIYGTMTEGEDRLIKLQYLHYEWIRITMENARRNRGFCNGILYWMLNDCWPASTGWALIDYYCRPKASWYSFRRCAKTLLASIDKEAGQFRIYACSDDTQDRTVQMTVSILNYRTGESRTLCAREILCPAATGTVVHTLPADILNENELLLCSLEGYDLACYKNGILDIHPVEAPEVTALTADTVTLRAKDYTHIVRLEGDCFFEDNYFALLPGQERSIRCQGGTQGVTVTAFSV